MDDSKANYSPDHALRPDAPRLQIDIPGRYRELGVAELNRVESCWHASVPRLQQ